jgi:hypothetical protein
VAEHWRSYEPIDDVVAFDADGVGPHIERLQVTANIHPNENYPSCRIAIHIGRLCSPSLTLAQSAELRSRLLAAENDVRAALPTPAITATGTEGRCECCSQPVRAGERIVVEDEDTEDRVVLHAGPCPAGSN